MKDLALLPSSIQSADDLQLAIDALERYMVVLRKKQAVSPEDAYVLDLLPHDKQHDQLVVEEAHQSLVEIFAKAPRLHVALVADAQSELRQTLTAWMRTNLHPLVLVEFEKSPSMLGGIIVRTPKRVYDGSFRTRLGVHPGRFSEVAASV